MRKELTTDSGQTYLTIEYDPTNHWVYANWNGSLSPAEVVAGSEACLLLAREHTCPYLLNDNRQLVGLWDHAIEWMYLDLAPRATAQGLTHFAHVVHPDSPSALSASVLQMGIEGPLQMRLFSTLEPAQDWLREGQQVVKGTSN